MEENIVFRAVTRNDLSSLRVICEELFPISYPDAWYNYVTGGATISVGGFIGDKIIALAIGEVRTRAQVQPEDHGLLPSTYYENDNFRLGYILSLGGIRELRGLLLIFFSVSQQYRCRGLASKLLAQQLQLFQEFNCSCVYLHVLSSNSAARIFYEKAKGFLVIICHISFFVVIK